MNTGKRILWIDYAKSICIYLVLLGHAHASQPVTDFIYTFHMPLFFFLSGCLFSFEKHPNFKEFAIKRFKGLMVPYLWINLITYLFWLFAVMGTSGFFTLYQIDDPYSIYVMTYGEYYLLILVGGYIATMFCAALTMLVTVKMHTPNLAVCIPFFLLCMIPFIARVLPAFDAFFNLLPTVLTNILNVVRSPILFQVGPFVFRQISFLMFLYILLFIVLLPLIYRGYSRYGLRKK